VKNFPIIWICAEFGEIADLLSNPAQIRRKTSGAVVGF